MKLAIKNKKIIINEIINNFKCSNSIVIIEYQKLTVSEFTKLRKLLIKQKSKIKVYKNNLVKFAIKEIGLIKLNKFLIGPNAFIFDADKQMSSLKILANFSKINSAIKLKTGIYEGKILETKEIIKIASLPTRNELLLIFISDILYLIYKLSKILKEIAKQKNK